MGSTQTPLLSGTIALVLLLFLQTRLAVGLSQKYCSSQNTAPYTEGKFWTWQSNGWCVGNCTTVENTAFAIVQGNDCWCSDYAPAEQLDVSDCNFPCPGFPDLEQCGKPDDFLYGYIALNKKPSGTRGSNEPSSTSTEKTTTSTRESTTAPSSTPSPIETTIFRTVTQSDGNQLVETIVSSSRPSGSSLPSQTKQDNGSNNTGAIVGGVLGGIALLAAIIGGVFFILWRRRRQQQQQDGGEGGQSGVTRNISTMSKAGLLRTGENPTYPPAIATNSSKRNSRVMVQDSTSGSPVSASDRRSSRPYIFDQRLNPSAIMTFDNASRGSFASLEDSRDYGRTLNVRNPDPDPDPRT